MNVVITCDNCAKTLRVPETALGKKVRCPACQGVFEARAKDADAITAAPLSRPSAVRPAPPPLPPAPEDDDERLDDLPEREPRSFPVLSFFATIKSDPDKKLKGQYIAELGPKGLTLKKKKQPDLRLPVGTHARHVKNNRIEVEIDDRLVEMDLAKMGWYCQRLARDTVAFLRGRLDEVDKRDYSIPWYLMVAAFLPAGIPIISLGGAIPFVLAGGLIGANMGIAQIEKLSTGVRLLLIFLISLAGYAIFATLVLMVFRAARA